VAVLDALRSGRPLKTAGSLAVKVRNQLYRSVGVIGERIVVDALSPEQALVELLDESRSKYSELFGRGFTQMGTGVAFERTAQGFRVVWVECLARPKSVPTLSDATKEP
jgi:hypothetical protein